MPVFDAAVVAIVTVLSTAFDAFIVFISPIISVIGTAITTLVTMFDTILLPAMQTLVTTINTGFQTLGDMIQSGFNSLTQSVTQLVQYLQQIAQDIANAITYLSPIAKLAITAIPIITLIAGAIADPDGAINNLFKWIIDLMLIPWPSTPTQFQLGTLVLNLIQFVPTNANFIVPTLVDTINGMIVMLQLFLFIKAVKMLPFF